MPEANFSLSFLLAIEYDRAVLRSPAHHPDGQLGLPRSREGALKICSIILKNIAIAKLLKKDFRSARLQVFMKEQ